MATVCQLHPMLPGSRGGCHAVVCRVTSAQKYIGEKPPVSKIYANLLWWQRTRYMVLSTARQELGTGHHGLNCKLKSEASRLAVPCQAPRVLLELPTQLFMVFTGHGDIVSWPRKRLASKHSYPSLSGETLGPSFQIPRHD